MKKILITAAALLALAAVPAEAKSKAPAKAAPAPVANEATDGFLICGLLVVPARCTMTERVVGGVVFGAALGAVVGSVYTTVAGASTVAQSIQNAALIGAGVGGLGGAAIGHAK
jgi:hypothetical protein